MNTNNCVTLYKDAVLNVSGVIVLCYFESQERMAKNFNQCMIMGRWKRLKNHTRRLAIPILIVKF